MTSLMKYLNTSHIQKERKPKLYTPVSHILRTPHFQKVYIENGAGRISWNRKRILLFEEMISPTWVIFLKAI